jgi:hypothetical protein
LTAPRRRTRVVAPEVGVSARTRLRVTPDELAVLAAMVEHTTSLRNADLAAAGKRVSRNDRRKAVAGLAHTRIVDTLTGDTDALVRTRRENLWQERASLRAAIATLTRRLAAPTRDTCAHLNLAGRKPTRARPCPACRDGYATRAERYAKRRRLAVLAARLAGVDRRLDSGMYGLLPGGRRRMRTRLHLAEASLSEQAWRDEWETARSWCAASGSTGENHGNRVFKLDADGQLRVTVPLPVAARFPATTPAVTLVATGVPVAIPSTFASRHCGAAVAIGRRGLGLRLTTRPARPAPHPRDGSHPATCGAGADNRTRHGSVERSSEHHPDASTAPAPPPRGRGYAPAATGAPGREHAYLPAATTSVTRRQQGRRTGN